MVGRKVRRRGDQYATRNPVSASGPGLCLLDGRYVRRMGTARMDRPNFRRERRSAETSQGYRKGDALDRRRGALDLGRANQLNDLSWCDLLVIGTQNETNQPSGHVPALAPKLDWVIDPIAQARSG